MCPTLPDRPSGTPERSRRWLQVALWAWAIYVTALGISCLHLGPKRQSVLLQYRAASAHWFASEPLYAPEAEHGFLYLPLFAVLHAPFHLLPLLVGGILWRAVNVGLFALGLWQLARTAGGARRGLFFAVASLTLLPLIWSSARHGQSTLAMAGAMLAAGASAMRGERGRAALWCALGLALKPLAIVLLLLLAASDRRLGWRIACAVAAVLLLPFLCQAPDYVAAQGRDFVRMLGTVGAPSDILRFPDLVHGLAAVGLDLPGTAALLLRALAALLTLGLWLAVRRRADVGARAILLYVLAAVYLLLFNPRTEHNTYSLAGPALGACAAWAVLGRRWGLAALHGALALLLALEHDISMALTGAPLTWTKPLMLMPALLALTFLQARRFRWRCPPATCSAPGPTSASAP